nr:hypothetical protein CFP56_79716 [Quercus suber]
MNQQILPYSVPGEASYLASSKQHWQKRAALASEEIRATWQMEEAISGKRRRQSASEGRRRAASGEHCGKFCGRLGHKKESCCYQVKQATIRNDEQVTPRTNETRDEVQSNANYSPWMVVTRKKNVNRLGRTNRQTKSNQVSQTRTKGSLDFSQEHYLEETGKNIEKSHHSDTVDTLAETTRIGAAQNPQKDLDMGTNDMVEDGKVASGSGSQQEIRQSDGKKLIVCTRLKEKEATCSEDQEGSDQAENGRLLECSNPIAKNWLGHMVQEASSGDTRRDHNPNSRGTDRNSKVVRGRARASMEPYFPHNTNGH